MIAFIKKELLEAIRTHKLLIMFIVFIFIGIMSPLTAKLTPKILEMAGLSSIEIGDPTAFDSFAQFFKNCSQIGIMVLVILNYSTLSKELASNTLVNTLTKGIKRSSIIISKFIVATLIWTLCYLTSFIITYLYTMYYFDTSILSNLFLAITALWLFGVLLISIILLGSVLFKGTSGPLLYTFISYIVLILFSLLPNTDKYNPITLTSSINLLNNTLEPSIIYTSMIITVMLIAVNLVLSINLFNKKEL